VIRVLLAEDQAMMRGALAVLLDLEDDIEVVAQVSDGTEIVPAALDARPDVALLDIELPGRSGLDAAGDLAAELSGCRVVMLTTFGVPATSSARWPPGPWGSWSRTAPSRGWRTRSARSPAAPP
jgi:two-component system response regulator DesR